MMDESLLSGTPRDSANSCSVTFPVGAAAIAANTSNRYMFPKASAESVLTLSVVHTSRSTIHGV
jgi:hypothetical protein